MQICRNYGSAKGCRYGQNCYYSHAHPESIKMCKFILKNKTCFAGNYCQFRHILFNADRQKQQSKTPTVTVEILENLFIEYYKHKETNKVQFYAAWKHKMNKNKNYLFRGGSPHKLLNYLSNNNAYGIVANIGLFVDKKTSYSNNKWHEWLKQDTKTYLTLSTDEQTRIIIKIRSLVNHYNVNCKHMAKIFDPSKYYKVKIVVYGFINHIIQKIPSIKYCPDAIMRLCFRFYYKVSKNELFDHTSTAKISDDQTTIRCNRRLSNIGQPSCLPFVVYKNRSFRFIKIKCLSISDNLTFSIGVINELRHLENVEKIKNLEFWPFDITEMELFSGFHRPKQFYFGDKNDQRRKVNADDIYCGVLCNNDIITMKRKTRQVTVKQPYAQVITERFILLYIHSKNGDREYSCSQFDGYAAIAFDFIVDQETKFEVLDVD